MDADDAGSSVRHQDLGPGSISLPSLPLSVPQLLPEGPSSSPALGLGKCKQRLPCSVAVAITVGSTEDGGSRGEGI